MVFSGSSLIVIRPTAITFVHARSFTNLLGFPFFNVLISPDGLVLAGNAFLGPGNTSTLVVVVLQTLINEADLRRAAMKGQNFPGRPVSFPANNVIMVHDPVSGTAAVVLIDTPSLRYTIEAILSPAAHPAINSALETTAATAAYLLLWHNDTRVQCVDKVVLNGTGEYKPECRTDLIAPTDSVSHTRTASESPVLTLTASRTITKSVTTTRKFTRSGTGTTTETPTDSPTVNKKQALGSRAPLWIWLASGGGVLVLSGVVGLAVWTRRRRRKKPDQPATAMREPLVTPNEVSLVDASRFALRAQTDQDTTTNSSTANTGSSKGTTWSSVTNIDEIVELLRQKNFVLEGKWEVSEVVLGAGGFGRVLQGKEIESGKPVAIKAIPLVEDAGNDLPRGVQREIRLLAAVRHSNVVAYLGHGVAYNQCFIVMEHLAGGTLEQLHHMHGPCTPAQLRTITQEMLSALAYLHRHRVVHGDLKPQNVLLDSTGRCRLVDFGLAKAFSSAVADTHQTTNTMPSLAQFGESTVTSKLSGLHSATATASSADSGGGTISYMAPEVFLHPRVERAASTDMWAFGLTILRLSIRGHLWDHVPNRTYLPALSIHIATVGRHPIPPDATLCDDTALSRLCDACVQPNPRLRPSARRALTSLSPTAGDAQPVRGERPSGLQSTAECDLPPENLASGM
eukprot:TRINITY_DN12303_c0_g1_i1.p1 TRINITY_DN12303_c0_g1~~TRINITY_DN12303_c0_g1_i1.p1  ORF type:complete len:755 (+),score=79.30 TRINITY_DN12303_c0_g1_i1:218-2266(+)